MHRLDGTDLLVAEIVALRAALKQVLVDVAMRQADPGIYLEEAFERAAEDVSNLISETSDAVRAGAIAEHATEILREIYTVTLSIE